MATDVTYPILAESTRDDAKNEWRHDKCNTVLMAATVHHPVHMRGTLAGFGEVVNEMVPYCPTCEEKPSSAGQPIYYN